MVFCSKSSLHALHVSLRFVSVADVPSQGPFDAVVGTLPGNSEVVVSAEVLASCPVVFDAASA